MKPTVKRKLMQSLNYLSCLQMLVKELDEGRGYKKRLAEVAGCQPAYLSQVLQGSAQLTPEQADKMAQFWGLNEVESEYFFTLVLLGRAGTPSLRDRLKSKLKLLRAQWQNEESTFAKPSLSESDRASLYYSSWLYSALHMLVTVPSLRKTDALAAHLKIDLARVEKAMKRLEKIGLVVETEKGWMATQVQVHAPDSQVSSELHHRNWRLQALQRSEVEKKLAVRYTSMHTLSRSDFQKICDILEESIRRTRDLIEPSPEEVGACLVMDYFTL